MGHISVLMLNPRYVILLLSFLCSYLHLFLDCRFYILRVPEAIIYL